MKQDTQKHKYKIISRIGDNNFVYYSNYEPNEEDGFVVFNNQYDRLIRISVATPIAILEL